MGTTVCHRPKGTTDLAFFSRELDGENATTGRGQRLVDGATVGGAFYGVLACHAPGRPDWAIAVVAKVGRCRGDLNFSYKLMAECDGPFYYDAPTRILDALSEIPLTGFSSGEAERAREWRTRCREVRARRGSLGNGAIVRFAERLTFGKSGLSGERFQLADRKRFHFYLLKAGGSTGPLVRIPRAMVEAALATGKARVEGRA